MPKTVTFIGDRVDQRFKVSDLIAALQSALVWLRGRDPESTVDWEVVKVKMGNPLRLTFSNPEANGAISRRMQNLYELQKKRTPKSWPRLTDEDIEGTKELASMIGDEFTALRISSPGEPTVKLTPMLVERVEQIAKVARGAYYEWGTLRGTLDQITVGSNTTRFRIKHALTGAEIGCTFPSELLETVKAALPARVEVYGRIRRNRSDQPTSVEVENPAGFRRLQDTFAPFNEVRPVDITAGVESSDFVERLRSGN